MGFIFVKDKLRFTYSNANSTYWQLYSEITLIHLRTQPTERCIVDKIFSGSQ